MTSPSLLPLSELIRRYSPLYGDSWEAVKEDFLKDPVERETVELLLEEMSDASQLREPICLGLAEDGDEDEGTLREFEAVLNGTHRVVAHMIRGTEKVYVKYSEEEEPEEWTYPYTILETEVKGPVAVLQPAEDSADAWAILRSLRINHDLWLTSSVGSQHVSGEDTLIVNAMWDSNPEELTEEGLNAAVAEKLTRFGYDVTLLEITSVRSVEEE